MKPRSGVGDLLRRTPGDPAHAVVGVELDQPPARGVRRRTDHHGRDAAARAVKLDHLAQRQLEQAVAVRDHEGLALEQRLGLLDAAAGVEDPRLPRVSHAHAEARPVADLLLDQLTEVVQVDHHLLDAAGAQELEDVAEERRARHGHQRLGQPVGQGREPRAASGRQDHGAPDHAPAAPSSGTQRDACRRAAASSGSTSNARRATAYTAGR